MEKNNKFPTKMICISINMEKTGANIKRLIKANGYSVEEIMAITGVSTPQAVYKWTSGKAIPSPENVIVLSMIFGVGVTELLVIDGDFDSGSDEKPD